MRARAVAAGTVCAVLLGGAGLAQAGQLFSPPYFVKTRGNNLATKAACVIRNTGTERVSVDVSVVSNNDTVGIFDFCKASGKPVTLAGGQSCLVSAELSEGTNGLTAGSNRPDTFVSCRVTAPNVVNLRGTLELADSPSHGFDVYLAVDF